MPHEHESEPDWVRLAGHLEREAELHSDALRQTVAWVRAQGGGPRRVLDLGSGPGVVSALIAEGLPEAEVTAVDGAPELLARARARADALGLRDRVHTTVAQLPADLGSLAPADLVWLGHVLHHLGDQRAALVRLRDLLNPGGLLVLIEGGLHTRFLPRSIGVGRPGLQTRLDAVIEDWFTAMRAGLPDSENVIEDWPALLTEAGLTHVGTKTFLTDHPAPLAADGREYLHARLARTHPMVGDRLAAEDLAAVDELLGESELGVRRRPDVFFLAARTVHIGRRD
ncbi:MAG TPA: class I SAM-dependent methyltransferase [Pseudonocardiaceae bacterium]|jgi:SAM-dependent methyltransferase|nr:class I SAM-dependent methyltransferase [Pseudonocardiaceae bacterium]